jgi:3-oxoacyl-[acyl-carrier-protein] synthase-1
MDNKTGTNIIGTNIISSLGFTTNENFENVKQGISGIKHYEANTFDLTEPFVASLIDKDRLNEEFLKISSKNSYTHLEKAAILSVFFANKEANIDLSNNRTVFIISTTKGNVNLLDMKYAMGAHLTSHIYLWHTAELITHFFGNPNTPIVVSNACISGAAAQITAMRTLQSGKYDYAVVTGVDLLSKFIISGFQSFKALSPELCKPFDKDRCGLNLGEAAATVILSNEKFTMNNLGRLAVGAVRNDANHISAPSRTGEGSYRALIQILSSLHSKIAFINAHGTATLYNDAMEMYAIARAGLEEVPVNALKSYFGHTLGAAGVVESIISMKALREGLILKTLGHNESEPFLMNNKLYTLNICKEHLKTKKNYFIKMMSGFGSVNVALLFAKN